MNEQLEKIKEAIAHELGLTDDFMDGTYLYYLTRSKTAFSVGTMSLDDFVEVDEELLYEVFEAIKPFFIQQAEYIRELEGRLKVSEANNDILKHEIEESKGNYASSIQINRLLRDENRRYKKALEDLANHGTRHDTNPTMVMDDKQVFKLLGYIKSMDDYVRDKASQALEESE